MASHSHRPPINDPQTFEILGAAFDVHRELGCGFPEPVYHEGLTNELARRDIPFAREVKLPVYYKGTCFRCTTVRISCVMTTSSWS